MSSTSIDGGGHSFFQWKNTISTETQGMTPCLLLNDGALLLIEQANRCTMFKIKRIPSCKYLLL